ncbi:putative signal transduction histidine-protein kinase [Podospora fimiseda]|uniref:histidine kinase n=1 Tax=Podospora fimiseda TaxID=252190 RepID=A0AAN6YNJ8_9PEZI|nr:putative signal transduction histidine-protein kinase [Podospora fimiseda]
MKPWRIRLSTFGPSPPQIERNPVFLPTPLSAWNPIYGTFLSFRRIPQCMSPHAPEKSLSTAAGIVADCNACPTTTCRQQMFVNCHEDSADAVEFCDVEVETSERARQREIAAYLSAASFPPGIPTCFQQTPFLSPDPVLNALTQLGALRLDCDRAFVSLIDRQYQYVVSEVTRSHSIRSMQCAPGDTVAIGVCKLRNCDGVCPATMKAFMDETGEWAQTGPEVIANRTRYIINDFRSHPDYMNRAYVTGYPYFTSYLEVPLVSPLGYLLGSYCVVDSKHNDFDNDEKVEILNEVADAIMVHLENIRIRQSRDRSAQLVQELSGFIRHEPPAQHPSHAKRVPGAVPASKPPPSVQAEYSRDIDMSLGSTIANSNDESDAQSSVSGERPLPPNQTSTSTIDSVQSTTSVSSPPAEGGSETPPTTPRDELAQNPMEQQLEAALANANAGGLLQPRAPPSDASASHTNGFISSANIKTTFFRAAATIRRAMNMDGIMFLDAVPSSYIDKSEQKIGQDDERDGPFCTTIVRSTIGPAGETVTHASQSRLPEVSLQRFIRAYPQGHVFTADEFGPIDDSYGIGKPFQSRPKADQESWRLRNDIAGLFRVLPSAKYVMFLPLWHFQRECWYAATLGWVEDPTRAIEVNDIGLISAFGNSVMAEVSRLEALAASRAKSDFVSSLSHELRSPLHGIMASSELLRENMTNSSLLPTLDMLDSCACTLLDTFNNLLDHATITHAGRDRDSKTKLSELRTADLSLLVEDVVEAVRVGHLSGNSFHMQTQLQKKPIYTTTTNQSHGLPDQPLLVIVKIGKKDDWKLSLNVGAWKRIVMNIFGNALKYTISGRIEVGLNVVQRANKSGVLSSYISLTVEDTGLGMSSDYLKYHIFTPFSQENSHSPGMGLGLSIVQQLVSDLEGVVNVRSSVGVGTSVEVLVPLNDSDESKIDSRQGEEVMKGFSKSLRDHASTTQIIAEEKLLAFNDHRSQLTGRKVCLITPRTYYAMQAAITARPAADGTDVKIGKEMQTRSTMVEKAIRVNAVEALGMTLVTGTLECPLPAADLYVIDSDIITQPSPGFEMLLPQVAPLVLLCSGSGQPSCVRREATKRHGMHLHHPIGPRKLASVFCSALKGEMNNIVPQVLAIDIVTGRSAGRAEELTVQTNPSEPTKDQPILSPRSTPLKDPVLIQPSQSLSDPNSKARPTCDPAAVIQKPEPKRSHHLLLVDDNPINIKLLTAVVRKLEHTFATAANGLEAVQLYKKSLEEKETRFDLVFMDISMPVMNGFEATRAIRQLEVDEGISRCKVVALTGLSGDLSRNEATASGCDLFLTKPVKMNMVRGLLDDMEAEKRELGSAGQ